jgi:putative transposase
MSDYRHGSHTVFSIHLHIVWITKYRRKILRGESAERVREIVREECRKARVEILRGHISADHVYVMVSMPSQVTFSRLIQRMKGKSSYLLFNEFPTLRKRYWGRHVWARGYFCRSSGNVTDEVIKAYIERQDHSTDDVFRIEGEASSSGDTPLGNPPVGGSSSLSACWSRSASGFSRNLDFSR